MTKINPYQESIIIANKIHASGRFSQEFIDWVKNHWDEFGTTQLAKLWLLSYDDRYIFDGIAYKSTAVQEPLLNHVYIPLEENIWGTGNTEEQILVGDGSTWITTDITSDGNRNGYPVRSLYDLTSLVVNSTNGIYKILSSIDLNGSTIALPTGVILEFLGGSINNGTISNYTNVIGDVTKSTATFTNGLSTLNVVSYQLFGAKLDGVTDDYLAIKACHDFANTYNLDVIQKQGKIYIAGGHAETITIRTNTDLSGCIQVIDDNATGNIWTIDEDIDNQLTDITSEVVVSELFLGANYIDSLSEYTKKFFIINGSRVLGTRPGSPPTDYLNKECFTILSDGVLSDGKLYCDYTLDDIELLAKDIDSRQISVKFPSIEFVVLSDSSTFNSLFRVKRNNAKIYLYPKFIYTSYPVTGTSTSAYALTAFSECYNISVTGGTNENKGRLYGEQLQRTTYVMAFTQCSEIDISEVCQFRGWGTMNTEYIKTVKIHSSVLNRFDNHFGISNLTFENCKVVGTNNCFNIGYGIGNVVVRNIDWILGRTTSSTEYTCVKLRMDLRASYRGNIFVENINIDVAQNISAELKITLFSCFDNYSDVNNNTYFTENTMGNVCIKNITGSNINEALFINFTFDSTTSFNQTIESFCFDNVNLKAVTNQILYWDQDMLSIKKISFLNGTTIENNTVPHQQNWETIDELECLNSKIYPRIAYARYFKPDGKINVVNSIFYADDDTTYNVNKTYIGCTLLSSTDSGSNLTLFKLYKSKLIGCTLVKNNVAATNNIDINEENLEYSILFGNMIHPDFTPNDTSTRFTLERFIGVGLRIPTSDTLANRLTPFSTLLTANPDILHYFATDTSQYQINAGGSWRIIPEQVAATWNVTTGSILTGSSSTYLKTGKQVQIAGQFTFSAADTEVSITMPFAVDKGGTITQNGLTFNFTDGVDATVKSDSISTKSFQISYLAQ